MIQEHRATMLEFQKAAVEANKTVQHQQHVMDQFPFYEEQSARSITHFHPILQLAQPNVQDSITGQDP